MARRVPTAIGRRGLPVPVGPLEWALVPALLQVSAKLAAVAGMAQFAQRLRFDLADALASDAEVAPNLLKRAEAAVVEPEAQLDDEPLAFGQLAQGIADLGLQ